MAKASGLEAGEFIHTIGDAHIYLNHLEALEEQVSCTVVLTTESGLVLSELERERTFFLPL